MSWWDRARNVSMILVAAIYLAVFIYEFFAPCGLHAMKVDTMLWIHTCGAH